MKRLEINKITQNIIGAAIEVHRATGPGLLESAYEEMHLDAGYRLDVLVSGLVVVEIKSVDALLAIHQAQLLTCMKLGEWPVGLLINFNVPILKNGVKRLVLGTLEDQKNLRMLCISLRESSSMVNHGSIVHSCART